MNSETPVPPSRDEALASLAEIDRIADRTRKAISAGCAAPLMILWGVIWVVGFGLTQLRPEWMNHDTWGWIDLAGIGGSFLLGTWFRQSPIKSPNQGLIGLSWLVLFGFAILWTVILAPWDPGTGAGADLPVVFRRLCAFWCTIAMFAYMIMGIWLDRFFLWMGIAITALTLTGFWFLPGYFYIWIGVTGGGALIGAGLFIRRYWR
jgi:hypothetical protein